VPEAGSASVNIHATGLLLDAAGVLIRGAPGSGKSLLALELLERWPARGGEAILVGDDRLDIRLVAGRPVMSAPPQLAGRIEMRGRGIIDRAFVSSAPVALLVDLVDDLVRMPEAQAFADELLGVPLPRCPVPCRGLVDSSHQLLLVGEALRAVQRNERAIVQNTT
jgi:serine kinase of HPr protein (carbohydrate metabolism regulator)